MALDLPQEALRPLGAWPDGGTGNTRMYWICLYLEHFLGNLHVWGGSQEMTLLSTKKIKQVRKHLSPEISMTL